MLRLGSSERDEAGSSTRRAAAAASENTPHCLSVKIVTLDEGTICYRVFSPLEMDSIESLADLRSAVQSDFSDFSLYDFRACPRSAERSVEFKVDLDARSNFRVEVDVKKRGAPASAAGKRGQRAVIQAVLPDLYDDRETTDERYVFLCSDDKSRRVYFRSEPARRAFCFYPSRVASLNLGKPSFAIDFDDVLCCCPSLLDEAERAQSFGSVASASSNSSINHTKSYGSGSSSRRSTNDKAATKRFSIALALKVGHPVVLTVESFYALASVMQSITHYSAFKPRLCLANIPQYTWEFNSDVRELVYEPETIIVSLPTHESKLGVKLGAGGVYDVVVAEVTSSTNLRIGDAVKRVGDVYDCETAQGPPPTWRELTEALKHCERPVEVEFRRRRAVA